MNQKAINQQHLRIATAITKAYTSVESGLITKKVFNSKLATAAQARVTLQASQLRLNQLQRGY